MMRRSAAIITILLTVGAAAYAGGNREKGDAALLIDISQLERMMSTEQPLLLDIRDDASYRQGHIPGAELLPLSDVQRLGPQIISMDRPIVTYCSCPAEESSLSAALALRDLGATRVYVLEGGYPAWSRERKPIIKGSSPS